MSRCSYKPYVSVIFALKIPPTIMRLLGVYVFLNAGGIWRGDNTNFTEQYIHATHAQ